jgi:hypothetical protein
MRSTRLPVRTVQRFNDWMIKRRSSRRWGPLIKRHLTIVTYTGRKSGRSFSLPVGYRRAGDIVTIGVQLAERKVWWRNFLGDGGPLSLELDGAERTGHAIARQDGSRAVVTVRLESAPITR